METARRGRSLLDAGRFMCTKPRDRHRAAQQIRFAKMPVRARSGSSPIRNSAGVDSPSTLASPPRRGEGRVRRGSLSAVEAIKQRARRGTTTSSDVSSENDYEQSTLKNRPDNIGKDGDRIRSAIRQNTKESTDLEDEASGSEPDDASLSSELPEAADSPSTLDDVGHPLTSSPPSIAPAPAPAANASPRRTRTGLAPLQTLPPRQPISKVESVSALSLALQEKRSTAASPFERFATLSGRGDPNPLHLKIYAPFSERPTKAFEVAVRRSVRDEAGWERKISVVETIGFSLWRYGEDKIAPAVTRSKVDVNRWMLRMVEDDEVDFDFPPLDRTKPMNDFASNNNRAARGRSNSKVYDEFALVEASEEEFRENEKLTPNPKEAGSSVAAAAAAAPQASMASAPVSFTPQGPEATPQPPSLINQGKRWNPVLGYDFSGFGSRNNSITPLDVPTQPVSHATPRKGPSKIVKVHLISAEGYSELVALDVTTDTYLAEVLERVCKKRNLDRAYHILKVSGTMVIAPLDRTVESMGDRADLDLVRRRFANDGSIGASNTPGSTPPNAPLLIAEPRKGGGGGAGAGVGAGGGFYAPQQSRKGGGMLHPLAQVHDVLNVMPGTYKRWTVWRRQPMSFMPTHERILTIDGEFLRISPVIDGGLGLGTASTVTTSSVFPPRTTSRPSISTMTFDSSRSDIGTTKADKSGNHGHGGGAGGGGGGGVSKTTLFDNNNTKVSTIHLGSIVGVNQSRKHPSHFRVVIFKAKETKRYDFEAQSAADAADIVDEIKRAAEPFQSGGAGGTGAAGIGGIGGGGSGGGAPGGGGGGGGAAGGGGVG